MTEISAYLLYLIMAIIMLWMWQRVRGKTIEDIVHESAEEHHRLNALYQIHPLGGSWHELQSWTEDEPKRAATSQQT